MFAILLSTRKKKCFCFALHAAIDSGGKVQIPRNFLPFGFEHGDVTTPVRDNVAMDEIILGNP